MRTLDNAADRTCIFAAFFCCCNYFHRTGTVLRGEAQKPGGERVKSRRLSNLIRVFMFVYPRSFDLTTGRRETLDWELQSCKVRRKVSTENARDRAYLSLCCQTRIVHFQYTTHIFPFKPPARLGLYCRRCKITCSCWLSSPPVTGALRDILTRDRDHHYIFVAIN